MAKLTEEQRAQRATARRRSAALAAEEDALRQERKRQEWDDNGTPLTRDEMEAGVPCRGCGQPIIDGLGDWPPLMKLTEQEKREYDAAQADFAARHKDCRGYRWSMSGSRALHCGYCCPRRRSASGSWRGSARCSPPVGRIRRSYGRGASP